MSKRTAVLLLLVTALGGCGSPAASPRIATAGGTPTASAAPADVLAQFIEAQRAWVACLRGEGVKVADPDPTGDVHFEGDPKVFKVDPKFQQAQRKCQSLSVPMPMELLRARLPKLTPEEIERAGRYARCMRENGAPDFPDPDPDGYFLGSGDGKPDWNQDTPGALKATAACESIQRGSASPVPAQG
ncbi:hypothetical protein [Hamadaea tsunoensis]|uniref:hypothetical protein n=1 Tax=Hamadaea tsunoensis TaxID=53368 RepID=UPI0007E8D6FD|nr:hypothetical protein [Hamadaea tsunoensis]